MADAVGVLVGGRFFCFKCASEKYSKITAEPIRVFDINMKKRYCVRVVQTMTSVGIDSHDLVSFVECLSYADLVTEHPIDSNGLTTLCFDIEAPPETDSKIWSEMNAERMRSFGYNAVSAPSTRRH